MNKENNKYYLFLFVLFLFCIAKSFAVNTPDYDLWARLLVGQHFFQTFSLMKHDIFSYTPTHLWYDHEWGSSVVFYGVLKSFGESGLTFLKSILIFLTLFFIHKTVKHRGVKTTISYNLLYYVFTFLAMFQVLAGTIRCHLFTFFFFSLWIYLLEKVRSGDKKWLYYFPLMMIVWNNLHGGCVSGIGLLLIYIAGEFLNKKPIKDYVVCLGLTCVSTLINPYGPKYILFLLSATTMERPLITEWKNSFDKFYMYDYIKYKLFLFVMGFTAFVSIVRDKITYSKLDKTKYLLLLVTAYLSIAHIKHQPFFVISAAVFLSDDFYSLFNSVVAKVRKIFRINSEKFIGSFVKTKDFIVYGFIVLVSLAALTQSDGEMKISKVRYPIYAVEFVKRNNLEGNLFINFTYGSYAAYKLFPNNKIVMDGRYEEVYDVKLIDEMRDFHKVKGNWKKVITDYKTDVMILEKKYTVFQKIREDKDWALIFEDKDYGVFVPSAMVRNTYSLPPKLDWYYDINKFNNNIDFKRKFN